MTKQLFIKQYIEKSNMSLDMQIDFFTKDNVVLPCKCGDKSCKGFAVVTNHPLSIKAHNNLYNKS